MRKIFAIGFNKTGTCSLNILFKKLGYKNTHNYSDPVLTIIDKYDAFTDGDHTNEIFKKYYEKYPNSLFILNTRPINKWLISRYKHARCRQYKKSWCWPISVSKTNTWIENRETHFREVLDYFSDKPKQLFIVNIERNGWENQVIDYIGLTSNRKYNIHKNSFVDEYIPYISQIKINVVNCLKNSGYRGDECLFKYPFNIDIYKHYL